MYFRLLQLELKTLSGIHNLSEFIFKIMSLFALANFAVIFVELAFYFFFYRNRINFM